MTRASSRWVLLLGVLGALARLPAAAQDVPAFAVVPVHVDEDVVSLDALVEAGSRATAVLEARGMPVAAPSLQRMRLEEYGRFPAQLSSDDRIEFERLARGALVAVARAHTDGLSDRGLRNGARAAIDQAMNFARSRLESLARDDETATRIMDACLLTPRAMLAQGAAEQLVVLEALECQKLMPGVFPSDNAHPPEVMAAFAKAAKASSSGKLPPGVLNVTTSDGCSNCRVYLNGRPVGSTPYRSGVLSGTYRVQVEYPTQELGHALVHEVTVTAPEQTRVVAEPFEIYLREHAGHVYVHMPRAGDDSALKRLLPRLGLSAVVLMRKAPVGFSYRVITGDDRAAPCTGTSPVDAFEPSIAAINACLEAGATRDATTQAPRAAPARISTAPRSSSRPERLRRTGIGLFVAGVLTLTGAGIADLQAGKRWDDVTNQPSEGAVRGIQAAGVIGSVTLVVSEPLWMPVGRTHAPWWTWAGGLIGVAPLVYGVHMAASQGDCVQRLVTGCSLRNEVRSRATLFLASSLPLLTLPISHYVARRAWSAPVALSARGAGDGAVTLVVEGTF